MSKRLVKAARKNSPSTGRHLEQNRALGGWPSALTGWVERERGREERGERETQRVQDKPGPALTISFIKKREEVLSLLLNIERVS